MKRMYEEGLIEKVGGGLQQKYYLEDAKESRKTDTTWWDAKLYTSTASSRLKALMGENVFDNPKPVELVERMIQLWARDNDDIILDFFAGSGTTGHAVFNQNASSGCLRRCILVQLPEPLSETEADQKIAAKYCKKIGKPSNIAELTKERLRRAAKKLKEEKPMFSSDLGFRVFKLDSSNIREWEPKRDELDESLAEHIEHLRADRSEQDILYELLLKRGLDLCVPIETKEIAGKRVHSIGAGSLFACLAESISRDEGEDLALGIVAWHKELDPAGDTAIVFRDDAFADDVVKTNVAAILEQNDLKNVRSL